MAVSLGNGKTGSAQASAGRNAAANRVVQIPTSQNLLATVADTDRALNELRSVRDRVRNRNNSNVIPFRPRR